MIRVPPLPILKKKKKNTLVVRDHENASEDARFQEMLNARDRYRAAPYETSCSRIYVSDTCRRTFGKTCKYAGTTFGDGETSFAACRRKKRKCTVPPTVVVGNVDGFIVSVLTLSHSGG
ncbi:hypothetical protein K0M31_003775 [Melipona bicolor]|uniref:Uncharacterized protein n=1 Tax=Melipona bicolor TaxID=60889 RepID=A0AA40KNT1_9HYME|nr:hypothetical protein K0M31_003775 [Melipona bicolor]